MGHKISLEDHLHLIRANLCHSSLQQGAQNMTALDLYDCSQVFAYSIYKSLERLA